MTDRPLLEVQQVRKVYGGEVALADASLCVGQGTIHGLLGANGAGKSTLVKIICGVERQDGGTVSIAGEQLPVPHTPLDAQSHGIAHIHQDRALVPDLSIAENLALTLGYPRRAGLVRMGEMRRAAESAFEMIERAHDVSTLVSDLPIADQTIVALVRALATDARLILLDEPTANLGAAEADWLYAQLKTLSSRGVSCLLITHALGEALDVCDEITVLRDGVAVSTAPAAELSESSLTKLMVGELPERIKRERPQGPRRADSKPRLRIEGLRYQRLGPLSLEVAGGEIVAVTGLPDSGHLLVGDVLSGDAVPEEGWIWLDEEPFAPAGVRAARALGATYVPPDRIRDGLAVEMTARENLFLDGSRFSSRAGGISIRSERSAAVAALLEASVKPADPEAVLSTLSGGNMQKVLVARGLLGDPKVLVLCEPTVGVDVRAREEIYERIRGACAGGLAVLLATSDVEEAAVLAHRVVVLRYGRVVRELAGEAASVDELYALSGGQTK